MQTTAVVCFVLLAVGAVGQTDSATQRNIAVVRKWEEVMQKMNELEFGDTEQIASISKELASKTLAKMTTCAFAPGTKVGLNLKDVSMDECFAALASKWAGIRQVQTEIISLAVDPNSGGKTILTEWQNLAEGITATGEVVPHSRISYPDMVRFDFDDAGLITGMTVVGDDGTWDTIQRMGSQLPGERNAKTAMVFGKAFQKLNGDTVSPELWAGVSKDLMSLSAPRITCAWAPGAPLGFDMKDISVEDCLKALGSTCPHCKIKLVSQEISTLAVEPSGKTVITEWKNVVDAVDAGMRLSYPDVMRLDFDDEGLVVAMTVIGDDGIMAALQGKAQALAGRARPDVLAGSLAVTCGTAIGLVLFGAAVGAWVGGRRGRTVGEPTLLA